MRGRAASLGRLRAPIAGSRGNRAVSVVLGGVAAVVGLSLLGSSSRRQQAARSERVSVDELPSVEDFHAQLAAVGLSPQGEPLALPEPAQRVDVIDVPAEALDASESRANSTA